MTDDMITVWAGPDDTAAWETLRRLHLDIARQLDADLHAQCGITRSTFDILNRIHNGNVPARLNELLDTIPLSQPTLSRQVDKLESQGLIKRQPDPRDRRAAILTLTASGRQTLEAAIPVHQAAIVKHLPSHLTVERFSQLSTSGHS